MKILIWIISGLVFVSVISLPGRAHAGSSSGVSFQSTRLQVFQVNYSGEKEKSFAEGGFGFGIEAYGDWGRPWGRIYTKARAGQASGRQAFLDGTTASVLNYSFYQGQFETGLAFFPVPARDTGLALYISAGGDLSYNWLALDSSTLTSLKRSESALGIGYTAGTGVEWTVSKAAGKKRVLTGEITYRVETTSLAGQSRFDLSGLAIHLGYGW